MSSLGLRLQYLAHIWNYFLRISMVDKCMQMICFDLASNLQGLKQLHSYHVTKFKPSWK